MSVQVKYPDIEVELVGQDGNAFTILGRVGRAIRNAHGNAAEREYMDEAMDGDYSHLLRVTARTVVIA
jgi:hypothetical protein